MTDPNNETANIDPLTDTELAAWRITYSSGIGMKRPDMLRVFATIDLLQSEVSRLRRRTHEIQERADKQYSDVLPSLRMLDYRQRSFDKAREITRGWITEVQRGNRRWWRPQTEYGRSESYSWWSHISGAQAEQLAALMSHVIEVEGEIARLKNV